MRRLALRAGIGVALAGMAAAALTGSATAAASCSPKVSAADEGSLTVLINRRRVAAGVRAVSRDAALTRAGRRTSMGMARGGAYAHSPASMAWARGRAAGQNLAKAATPAQALDMMLASSSHRQILLDAQWRLGGVGAARGCEGVIYFTVNLMAPPPRG
jgi:uncharacterized protein YkwD